MSFYKFISIALAILCIILLCCIFYNIGRMIQCKDNVAHGVMTEDYKWLNKYELAR